MPQWGGANEKCKACNKTVYEMEKLSMEQNVFHKTCFKCTKCGKVLRAGDYAGINGKVFCKPHFKQLFQLKGNYEDGFNEAVIDSQKEQNKEKKSRTLDVPHEPEAEPEAEVEAEAEPEAEAEVEDE